jgi:hypothetical protein
MGSWPAKQIVLAAGEDGNNLPLLTANDIDVYTGTPGKKTQVAIDYHSIQYLSINGISQEVNTVSVVQNFGWKSLLDNNDINATAVAIEVQRDNHGVLLVEFHVSLHFWGFLFGGRVLKAVNPASAQTKTLVRLAYKAFPMNLEFDGANIDPCSEISLYNAAEYCTNCRSTKRRSV